MNSDSTLHSAARSFIAVCSVLVLLLTGCGKKSSHPKLAQFINRQVELYPKMTISDVYKLLYQAEMGPRHILDNPPAAKEYLLLEAASARDNAAPRLIDECSPDSSLIRVNLKPFVDKHLSLDTLFVVMMESAERIDGSMERVRMQWSFVGQLIREYEIPFSREAYDDYTKFLESKNYPAVHHSREYTTTYQPAYRIVQRALFHDHFGDVVDK